MIYGAILAGGIGTRMGAEKPKQYSYRRKANNNPYSGKVHIRK